MSDNKYRAAYNREMYQAYTIRIRKDKHADLIDYLESSGEYPSRVIYEILMRSMKAHQRRQRKQNENQ